MKREQIGLTFFRARIRKPAVLIQLSQKKNRVNIFFTLYNIESEFCDVIGETEQKLFRYKRASL